MSNSAMHMQEELPPDVVLQKALGKSAWVETKCSPTFSIPIRSSHTTYSGLSLRGVSSVRETNHYVELHQFVNHQSMLRRNMFSISTRKTWVIEVSPFRSCWEFWFLVPSLSLFLLNQILYSTSFLITFNGTYLAEK